MCSGLYESMKFCPASMPNNPRDFIKHDEAYHGLSGFKDWPSLFMEHDFEDLTYVTNSSKMSCLSTQVIFPFLIHLKRA